MELGNSGKSISYNKSKNELWYKFDDQWRLADDGEVYERVMELYSLYRKNRDDVNLWSQLLRSCIIYLQNQGILSKMNNDDIKFMMEKIINFFSEFEFVPNFRFVNTFAHRCHENRGKEYVLNYFKLQDSVCAEDIKFKMESPEFGYLTDDFKDALVTKKINNRLKIYYGPQGTGKTTQAVSEAGKCIVCHSAMLPSDLMEDFKFVDGKATFDKSALWSAMESGDKIVLDEINLLPFESLRFLQSILDDKKEISYKGHTVEIKPGFQIIGTMNLVVNGMKYPLPEPLVDRCEDIKEFGMTADLLTSAL